MINLARTTIPVDLKSDNPAENHSRQRMRLAFALFDVETAHGHLAETDPSNERLYTMRLGQLKVALKAYWRIDEQIEHYLQSAQGN